MLRRVLAVLMAAACITLPTVLAPTPALAVEYVTNGNFSANNAGWNWPGAPLMWYESCCSNPPGGYPDAYAHPNGQGTGTSLGAYLVTWQNIANAPSGSYTLSGRIDSSGGTQSVWIQADNGVFDGRYCRSNPSNTASWLTVSCTFNYTAGNTLHIAMVALNTAPTAGGWVNFDDISLTGGGGGGGIDTAPYDLANYLTRTDGGNGPVYNTTTGEVMQIQYNASLGRYYQVKNAHWEELSWNSSYVLRYRDTSDPNTWYGLYANGGATLGDNWIQRFVSIGTALTRNPTVKVYGRNGCPLQQSGGATSRIVVLNFYPTWNSGAGPNLNNVIQLQSQLPNGSGGWTPWEDYYYAKGVGLVKFYDNGGTHFEGHFTGFTSATLTREVVCTP